MLKAKRNPAGRTCGIEGLESRTLFAVFTVTDVADAGPNTLRQAIIDANAAVGQLDTINFTLPGPGVQTITPLTALPALTDTAGTVIDGRTQPGFAVGSPTVVIDGSSITGPSVGFQIDSGATTIAGLGISGFHTSQIATTSSNNNLGNNVIIANTITGDSIASDGITINSASDRIGGPTAADRNIISGNGSSGISIDGNTGVVIQNNRIGTNAAGTAAVPNQSGITISFGVSSVTISDNLISGNTGSGMALLSNNDVTIDGNFIGVDATGAAALGNGTRGIHLVQTSDLVVSDNVISGNGTNGVEMGEGGGDITGNKIGTNAAGTAAIPNGMNGIAIAASNSHTISGNLISGNGANGISIDEADAILVQNNKIGTDAAGTAGIGNGADGVLLGSTLPQDSTEDNVIGGTTAGQGNIIAFNTGNGVQVLGYAQHDRILGNSIFSNTRLGIDLSLAGPNDGRTPNSAVPDVPPFSANNLQNFPVITQSLGASGQTTISGYLQAEANTAHRIEFFGNAGAGTVTANAEGQTFLGFVDATTNASGFATFTKQVTGALPVGRLVTATATSASGDTSEFSDPTAAGIPAATIEVRGNNVVIVNGDASAGVADFTDFGSSVIGTPITRTFVVNNTGTASLDLTVSGGVTITGPGASQFSLTSPPNASVSGGQSTAFTISFTPSAAGTQTATVSIGNSDVASSPFTFSIIGTGTTAALVPEIEVSGGGIPIADGDTAASTSDLTDFGNGTINGTAISRTFTIANSGQTALSVSGVTLSGEGAAQYAVLTQPATSVATGQSTTFVVRFTPQSGGQFNATVSIASNDSDENPYTFAISGIGIAGDGLPPSGSLVTPQPSPVFNNATYDFIVRYTDDRGFISSTFDNNDIVVTGPNGFSQTATFVSSTGSSTQFDATYRITAPGGTIESGDNGTYTATIKANAVSDNDGNVVPAGVLGTFELALEDRISAGQVGLVNGKKSKLSFVEADNTVVTVTLTGGTGEVFKTDNGRFDLDLTASAGKVNITTKGGNGRAEVNSIRVTGGLKSLVAKTADVTGVVSSTGPLSAITLGSTSSATISTPGVINSINIGGVVVNTHVFSGALVGADGRFGGTGTDADTAFSGGEIRKIIVGGAVTSSLFAAGFDPVDSTLLNGNGIIVGGASSRIKSIKIRGLVDQATVFTAGTFPKSAKFGSLKVIPASDARFDATA